MARIRLCVLSAVLPVCFLVVLAEAQTDSTSPVSSTGEVHGSIVITKADEMRDESVRTGLFGRYAAGQGREGSLLMHAADTLEVPLSEKAAVYLEGEGLSLHQYPPSNREPALDQRNMQFHPQVLPILAGTTVRFPNRDHLFHNVFSYSQAKEFDLGRYPINDSRSVTFDKPGVVRVYCDIHSNMNAIILVLPHPYFATPDDEGRYQIRHVPPGRYTLVLWCGREIVAQRTVTIRPDESIEENFTH